MVSVAVCVEGPTEWQVTRKLHEKGIISGGNFIDTGNPSKMIIGDVGSSLEKLINSDGQGGILIFPPADRILLLYDQEKMKAPSQIKYIIEKYINRFGIDLIIQQHAKFSNVFIGKFSIEDKEISVAIHVADKLFCQNDGNKDFDGYILELLSNQQGYLIIQKILLEELRISALRSKVKENPDLVQMLHQLGEKDIPFLMENKDWSIMRSKTILYSYITALQLGINHVWFCKYVVEKADERNLRTVFASLIAAWDELCKGG
jgi:hypothetical protein